MGSALSPAVPKSVTEGSGERRHQRRQREVAEAEADVGCQTRSGLLPGKPSCEQRPAGQFGRPGFAQERPRVFAFGGASGFIFSDVS